MVVNLISHIRKRKLIQVAREERAKEYIWIKRDEETDRLQKLRNHDLPTLYSSSKIIKVRKSRTMALSGRYMNERYAILA
jgi:hypothetical protein